MLSARPGKQHVYLPREQSRDFEGISTDVCDFSVEHLGMSSTCLADGDGGKWCQKRVNKSLGSPKEWRLCDESCPIALEKGKYFSLKKQGRAHYLPYRQNILRGILV